jgi:carbonic anhydrase
MPRKRVLFGVVVASLALTAPGGKAQHAPHWGYAGEEGPSHWAKLAPEYDSCAGKQQSHVDLDRFSDVDLPKLAPHYNGPAKDILNNGHTVQADFAPGSTLTLDGTAFTLKQVHVHLPSEHTLHGKPFPMEAHLVHADAAGHLAVVAVLFEAGTPNAQIAHLLKKAPAHAGAPMPLPVAEGVVASGLLPRNLDYFRYSGSLTTPPCSEGVRWIVLQHPVQASDAQMHALAAVLGHPNNRPVQPIGARRILE